jgi:hypothetical protein
MHRQPGDGMLAIKISGFSSAFPVSLNQPTSAVSCLGISKENRGVVM